MKNPLGVWILRIRDPFLDFSQKKKRKKKAQSAFWIQESVFGFSHKKRTLFCSTFFSKGAR